MNNKVVINKKELAGFVGICLAISAIVAVVFGAITTLISNLSFWHNTLSIFTYCLLMLVLLHTAKYVNYFFKIKNWIIRNTITTLGVTLASMYLYITMNENLYGSIFTFIVLFILYAGDEIKYGNKCPKSPFKDFLVSDEEKGK